jgi:hypothetical protein
MEVGPARHKDRRLMQCVDQLTLTDRQRKLALPGPRLRRCALHLKISHCRLTALGKERALPTAPSHQLKNGGVNFERRSGAKIQHRLTPSSSPKPLLPCPISQISREFGHRRQNDLSRRVRHHRAWRTETADQSY